MSPAAKKPSAKQPLLDLLAPHLCDEARREAFSEVCDRTENELTAAGGIGTLAEKTIHSVLKHFYAGVPEYEERRVLPPAGRGSGFVADVARPDGIFEVQTRHFYLMKRKITAFLMVSPVTIVYPVVFRKTLRWVDPEDGTVSAPRRTGKLNFGHRVLAELYSLGDLFPCEGLSVRLALLDVEEYKILDGYGPDRKIRASRSDGFPQELVAEVELRTPADYAYFLPATLPEEFTSADYAAACTLPRGIAQTCVRVLTNLGVLTRVPSGGRGYLYRRSAEASFTNVK